MNNWQLLRVYPIIILLCILWILQLAINQISHSLTVLADCYHNLYTFISFILLIFNEKTLKSVSLRATFGWARIEVLGTLVNIIFMLALCFSICVEGLQSLVHSSHHNIQPTHPFFLLISGIASLFINWIKFIMIGSFVRTKGCYLSIQGQEVQVNCIVSDDTQLVLQAKSKKLISVSDDKSNRECLLEQPIEALELDEEITNKSWLPQMIKESGTSTLLIITSTLILLKLGSWVELIDSILGILSVVFIFASIYPTLKESGLILLQTAPNNIDLKCLHKSIQESFPSILNVHDLHVWCLTGDHIIATCHLLLTQCTPTEYSRLSLEVKDFFLRKGISFVTIQPEFQNGHQLIENCMYICKNSEEDCLKKVCCHPHHSKTSTSEMAAA